MDEINRALVIIKESISDFDDTTRAHSRRMMILSRGMVETIGLSESDGDVLELTCAIHDIGKRFIPACILNKKGRLTEEEWAEIKTHPLRGWELLSQYAFLRDMAEAILHHHERWDGTGYPYGRKMEAIPVIARIVSVIDAFDAMTNARPYNLVMSINDALAELGRHAGTQFDPDICKRFVRMYKERFFLTPILAKYVLAGIMSCQIIIGLKEGLWFMRFKSFAFILVLALFLLTICSMTSFLYPIHNRVDQNCFMTIGKGILKGQVPYRDLFDQKGPVIFFMHALASRISTTSFIGVYFLQYVFLIVFMIYTRKTACLFVPEKKANFIVFFTLGLIMTSRCYLRGDNVEEFVLPLIAISMYYMLDMYLNGERGRLYNLWMMFLNGIFVGFVFWLKFNLLGFWIGFFLFSLVRLIKYKRFGELIASLLMVLTGFVIVTAPVLLYFHGHNALDDLFYTYFYCNIFLYNSGSKLLIPVYFVFNTLKNIGQNIVLFPVMVLGIYKFALTSKYLKNRTARRFLLVTFVISYLGVTFSNVWYDYYLLIVTGFTVFGVIALYDLFEEKYRLKIVEKIPKLKDVKLMKRTIVIFSLAYVLLFNNCMPYLFRGKLEYPQYKFASIINKRENATMLNYGFVDGGFYFASGIQPEMKFFQTNNITYEEFPEMHDEQTRIIANKQVDFVVARVKKREKITDIRCPVLFENYEIIETAEDIHDRYRYILFEKKD